MAPRDEAMLVHMLHTAIAHDGPAALRYPRGAAEGVALPARAGGDPDRQGRDARRGRAGGAARLRLRRPGRARGGRDARRARPRGRRSPTPASPSRSMPSWLERLAREHDLLVTIEENVLPGGFGSGRAGAPRGRLRGATGRAGAGAARSACRTATSPTASRRCCARRSASPVEAVADRVLAATPSAQPIAR